MSLLREDRGVNSRGFLCVKMILVSRVNASRQSAREGLSLFTKNEQQASLSVYIGRKTAFDLWRMAVKLRNPLRYSHFGWTCAVDSHTTCISQHNKAFLIVNHDDAHRKKIQVEKLLSCPKERREDRLICPVFGWHSCMQNERTREVMLSFFVWMLAGFIIRVCLACGRPQHAVGFHYVVYSYIVFVLLLHRTWRRKQLLLVASVKVDGEGRGWTRLQVRISSSP